MKISVRWLKQLVETDLDAATLARLLTMAGLEVESVTSFGALAGVVVAEVRGKRPHPNAAKLTLVDVWAGPGTSGVTQVVCGAPNVPEPGARVLWAPPGARLPSGITLAPKEVRGVVSPGMLCAEDELGFGASHDGIIVVSPADGLEPGRDLAEALGLPDEILEINVTPNRPDCLGHLGIAREVAALTGCRLRPVEVRLVEPALPPSGEVARVELVDAQGCPRYTALVLEHVQVGPSPLAVRLRLSSLGVRAISNVVDATNLVLLELGQPLHAFDLDKLAGHAIVVRRATDGEKLSTLDGQERTLSSEDLAICDAGKPVALAGVMGGATSEVSASTTRVLLESAYFQPARVRRTAKRLGLHTEASQRFERGVDPEGAAEASRRCAQLMQELAGARVAGHLIDLYPQRIEPQRIALRAGRTRALLGIDLDAPTQADYLVSLGLQVESAGETLHTLVPTRRPDLQREVDLIEEIARVHGYDKILAAVPPLRKAPGRSGDELRARSQDALRGLGFEELQTYAFVPPRSLAALGHPADDPRSRPLRVLNPIREEQSAMRTSLVPGLLHALERNLARGQNDLKLFELAEVFLPRAGETLPDERRQVAGVMSGRGDGWLRAGAPFDLFDIKGAAEELLSALGHSAELDPAREPWLHPGVQASLVVGGRPVGALGELHPDLLREFGIEARAFAFEIDLGALGAAPPLLVAELPRFPSVSRDLSFFVDAEVPAKQIAEAIDRARDPLCVEVRLLEDYREAGKVPVGHKGMLWSFTYRAPDRTLTDAEVQALHESLLERLRQRISITPR